MAQLVATILSNQDELAAKARLFTGDVNEASLLVGQVMSRAFRKFDREATAESITRTLRRDLDTLIQQHRVS